MNKKDWIYAIIAMIVIVLLVYFIAPKITGNIVKVPTSVATTQTDIYTKAEVDTKIKQVFASCSPSSSLSSDKTGIQTCSKEGKTCLMGTNFARVINTTSGTVMPLHFNVLNCSEKQNLYSDPLPSDLKLDVDPSWICCKA